MERNKLKIALSSSPEKCEVILNDQVLTGVFGIKISHDCDMRIPLVELQLVSAEVEINISDAEVKKRTKRE